MKLNMEQVRALQRHLGCATHATFRAAWSAMPDERRTEVIREVFP